ncbi:carbohydrate kinase family protein [Streptomyces pinistramenti]|uniref:carbohydrate kinase family protein n=1 Tax=Streptomyces pinistramenti TaxID=2884812 RepID=UPI001D07CE3D|nr:carbohydrate kinase family protein [Streptomyces pinistramenti]MCB5910857.1 carbohydrate kinase family protein [Streptomyces pinistramenti]
MRIAVTGSIATDHLMVFPGKFSDQLLDGHLDKVSLSFLADKLEIRQGGVGANIALGLARLGMSPALLGAVGRDASDYLQWLAANGVETEGIKVSAALHTARFVCTTDSEQRQIATFYAGAMSEARDIALAPAVREGLDLVVVAPNDPEAMRRHTDECREYGIAFAADPSQQLARLEGPAARQLVEGARFLFTNEYEAALLRQRTGWTVQEILARVGTWITTLGPDGATIARTGEPEITVPAVPTGDVLDPTGVGDIFRSGFLAGVAWGLPYERAVQLGCALASVVLESIGTQEYELSVDHLMAKIDKGYGATAAAEIRPHLEEAL